MFVEISTVEDCSIKGTLFFVSVNKLVPGSVGFLFFDQFLGKEGPVGLGFEGEVSSDVEG
jgi:hypothetical protein